MIDFLKPFDTSGETEGDNCPSSLNLEMLIWYNKFGRSRSSKSSVGICAFLVSFIDVRLRWACWKQ